MKQYYVIDNKGITDGPFANEHLAKDAVKANYKEGFKYAGNCWIVEKVLELDNYLYNGGFDEEIKAEYSL